MVQWEIRRQMPAKSIYEVENTADQELLREKVTRLHEIKVKKEELDLERAELITEVGAIQSTYGRSLNVDGIISTITNGANVSYSKDKLKDAMLVEGIRADVIERVIAAAKNETKYTTVSVKMALEGGQGE
jgi:hypothetical protein